MTTIDADKHVDKPKHLVAVKVNGVPKEIRSGEYTGRTLKLALGVPVEHTLELVRKGEFKTITDCDDIKVKGGEEFVSHCGQGQSS